jgi:polyisoprenoid-binding protein YceI
MQRHHATWSRALAAAGFLLASGGHLRAEQLTFDFKDPKGVNAISLRLDSTLEPMIGFASGISGTVQFDPAEPKRTSGKLEVPAKDIDMSNDRMTSVLHGPDWLDVAKHPKIEFAIKEVKDVRTTRENNYELTVLGDFSCKGVTKPITVTIHAHYLPGKLGERLRDQHGDLLVLRSDFTVRRSDYGIKPGEMASVVAEEIQVQAAVVGLCPKEGGKPDAR